MLLVSVCNGCNGSCFVESTAGSKIDILEAWKRRLMDGARRHDTNNGRKSGLKGDKVSGEQRLTALHG